MEGWFYESGMLRSMKERLTYKYYSVQIGKEV
jgi:hypothetical protein